MTSEIRINTLKNRVGLGTVSLTNTGVIVSGIITANSFSGALTSNGDITGTGDLTLTSTDAGSSAAPIINLFRNSASPADADYLGQIKFQGESDTGVQRNYAKITGKILDASNGTEDGIIEFAHIKAGSQTITGRWRSDSLQLLNGTNFSVAGTAEVTGQLRVSDGSTSLPSVAAASDTNSGLYFAGADAVGLVAGGSRKLLANSSGVTINNGDLAVNGGNLDITGDIRHIDNTNTKIAFTSNQIDLQCAGASRAYINNYGMYMASGFALAFLSSSGPTPHIKSGGSNHQDLLFTTGTGNPTRMQIYSNGQVELSVPDANDALKITPGGTNAHAKINFNTPGLGSAILKVQGTERLAINSTGNLTFTGPSNSYATIQYASNFTKLDLRGNGIANSYHYILSYGAGHGEADNFHMVNKTTNGNITFRTGSVTDERLTITADGNVGVGIDPNSSWKTHIKSSSFGLLRLETTLTGSDGPYLELYHNSTSPDDNDELGIIQFKGKNTNNDDHTYAYMMAKSTDVSDGTEDGDILFATAGDGATAERLRITSTGHVLFSGLTTVHDTRNAKGITIKSSSGGAGISFQNFGSNGSKNWRIRPDDATSWGSLDFSVGDNPNSNSSWPSGGGDVALSLRGNRDVHVDNGNLVIGTSGKGISFAATGNPGSGASMANELLDDYEEGSWTPLLHGYWSSGWRQITIGSGTVEGATYTRVGRLVYFKCYFNGITMSGNGPNTYARIYGLPYQCANDGYGYGTMVTHSNAFENTNTGNFYVNPNTSDMISTMYGEDSFNYARWSNSSFYMMLSGVYQAA